MKHLPLGLVFLLVLLLGPYLAVQMCPDTSTQQGRFMEAMNDEGKMEVYVVTPSISNWRRYQSDLVSSDVFFRASLLANRFYFGPIAIAHYKVSGQKTYKFL